MPGYAAGVDTIVTRPHLFMAGESGAERLRVEPVGRQSLGDRDGVDRPIVIQSHITLEADGRQLTRVVRDLDLSDARRSGIDFAPGLS